MKEKIACILKECRKKNKFSVDYVANELKSQGFEIAPKTLYGYETGKNQPNADIFLCLCKIYNITSFDMFFDEVNTEYTNKSYGMSELGLMPEEWGGDTVYCNISAKKGIGIEELLETLTVVAELADLKANPKYTQKESKSIENTISDFDTAIPVSINTKVKTNKD